VAAASVARSSGGASPALSPTDVQLTTRSIDRASAAPTRTLAFGKTSLMSATSRSARPPVLFEIASSMTSAAAIAKATRRPAPPAPTERAPPAVVANAVAVGHSQQALAIENLTNQSPAGADPHGIDAADRFRLRAQLGA